MSISLSRKVFLAVQALCTVVVLAMGVAAYLSFNLGFLGYLNEQAVERMMQSLPRIEQAYAEQGSWAFLTQEPGSTWFHLMRPEAAGGERFEPRRPPVSDLTGAFLRVTLLDADKRYLAGYAGYGANPVLRPVQVHGQVVGWLAMTPFETVSAVGDQRFHSNQVRSGLLVGLLCVLLSAVIAGWFTRALLRPVQRVARATRQLAEGDLQVQVPITGNDEVAQLARDFNHMAQALARNEQQRRDFMADISHELRTPLAVLRAELEAIEDGIRQVNAGSLASLQGEVGALTKLVDDLYELSLAEVGGPSYRHDPLDLGELATDAASAWQGRLAEHGLALAIEVQPLPIVGDERRLAQVLYNLLENSLRYTDPGGAVRWRAYREGRWACLACEDAAPGVPVAEQERLFERFYRLEASRNRGSGGAGLGLAICRAIVEVHGGHLRAWPSPLGGLGLTLQLPLEQQA
ncbi:ATP-binding protein [Pseudomonas typographi]|uniref:histidine kinase n=1 Tax=Pseudomonas typographi TaxID=2715964 RepID=A0ABR7Z592_9PSED|nr:ATP-binding protein [Pseudomonas typographi]MBD1554180.1 HAMP domain-containing protein [Pseudomonas typographi]MBD1589458.1 HAMP domain-containing protein [Pseudomonas typographi]MBD1600686.1 HAMP domain-containing protein [Pseudomonas typographi]